MNLSEYFLPIELSEKAKECGFDEECLGYFYRPRRTLLAVGNTKHMALSAGIKNSDFEDNEITAPMIDQIIDWFFKRSKLSIEAPMYIPQSGEYDGCYCFKSIVKGDSEYKDKILFEATEPYPTKRKALLKAIEEAFKIITV